MIPKLKINLFLEDLYYCHLLNKNLIQDTPYDNFDVLYEGSNGIYDSIILNMDSEDRSLQIKKSTRFNKDKLYRIMITDKLEKTQLNMNFSEYGGFLEVENKLLPYERDIFKIFKDVIEDFINIFEKNHPIEHFGGNINFLCIKNKEHCLEISVNKYIYLSKIVSRGELNLTNINDNLLLECYQILQNIKKNNNISDAYQFFIMNQHHMMFTKNASIKNEELEIDLSHSKNIKASLQKWFNAYRRALSIFKGEPTEDPFQICLNLHNIHDSKYESHELVENKVEREEGENVFSVYL